MNSPPPPHPPIPTQIVIEDDADILPSSESLPRRRSSTVVPINLPLVDEVDLRQCFLFDKIPSAASMQGMVIGKEELNVICGRANNTQSMDDAANRNNCSRHGGVRRGNSNIVSPNQSPVRKGEFKACPCCRRYIENLDHNVSPGSVGTSSIMEEQKQQQQLCASSSQKRSNSDNMDEDDNEEYGCWNLQRSMLTSTMGSSLMSLFNGGSEDFNHQDDEEEFHMAAAPLVKGDKVHHYTITETIVQGWLYKKGSGKDIWGTRWWKPRWVTLALAIIPGRTVPMPLIISHHAPGVPFPAHVMELNESTVVMAIERTTQMATKDADGEDIEEWNRHCIQIVNSGTNESRMFTAPLQERNEWAFVINKQLYSMEERLKKARAKEEIDQYTQAKRGERKAKRLGMDLLLKEMKEERVNTQRQQEAGRPMSPAGRRSIGLPPRVSPPR